MTSAVQANISTKFELFMTIILVKSVCHRAYEGPLCELSCTPHEYLTERPKLCPLFVCFIANETSQYCPTSIGRGITNLTAHSSTEITLFNRCFKVLLCRVQCNECIGLCQRPYMHRTLIEHCSARCNRPHAGWCTEKKRSGWMRKSDMCWQTRCGRHIQMVGDAAVNIEASN